MQDQREPGEIISEIEKALALRNAGKADQAQAAFEKLLEAGEYAEHILWPLAEIYLSRRQEQKAVAVYTAFLAAYPDKKDARYNLAFLLKKLGRGGEALAEYQKALELGIEGPEEVYLNMAVIRSDMLRDESGARADLEKALSLKPSYIPALFNLANLNEQEGKAEAAIRLFGEILTLDPSRYEALARLADLRKYSAPGDPVIVKIREALDKGRMDVSVRVDLHFALGKALDDCGLYDEAFASYRAGNELDKQQLPPYDRKRQEAYINELIKVFSREWFAALEPVSDASPVFICGMFRSGSTLVERVLAAHPKVTAGGELEFFPRKLQGDLRPFPASVVGLSAEALKELAAGYLDHLAGLFPGYEIVTDKRPDNFLSLGLIKSLFPGARIILTGRNPLDNCLSLYFQRLGPLMNYAADLENTAHYFLQGERLMDHWRSLFGDNIHEVSYDDLVAAPEETLRELVAFCGLEWDERCLEFHKAGTVVKTASVMQVRRPLYKSSSGRWRNYAAQLARIEKYFKP